MGTIDDRKKRLREYQRVHVFGMPPEGWPLKTCPGCGKKFLPVKIQQKYCHKNCGTIHRRPRYYKTRYGTICKTPRDFIRNILYTKKRYKQISVDYVMSIYDAQGGKCALSGRTMTFERGKGHISTNISIDRIDSNRGYEKGNIQLVCYIVNILKARFSQDELISLCQDIVEFQEKKHNEF